MSNETFLISEVTSGLNLDIWYIKSLFFLSNLEIDHASYVNQKSKLSLHDKVQLISRITLTVEEFTRFDLPRFQFVDDLHDEGRVHIFEVADVTGY